MTKNHLKSLSAPKTWQIKRKKTVYLTRPIPSGQKMEFVMPINLVFKNMLKYCKTTKEVNKVLLENDILVDGKKVRDSREAMGIMSVLTIGTTNENYRMLINTRGKLILKQIEKKEAGIKPCVIQNKQVIGKNKIQLNLSDGRNINIKKNDYKTGDSLVIELPKQEIKEHIKLDVGAIIMLYGGKYIGKTGTVDLIEGSKIRFTDEEKKSYETKKSYAYPIGVKKPAITV